MPMILSERLCKAFSELPVEDKEDTAWQRALDEADAIEAELKAMREDVETTMHDFAYSAEAALSEDPPSSQHASAMETACVCLRAILIRDFVKHQEGLE